MQEALRSGVSSHFDPTGAKTGINKNGAAKRQPHKEFLLINQFCVYDFFDPFPDSVHPLHPSQLILGFEFFRNVFAFGVLHHQQMY